LREETTPDTNRMPLRGEFVVKKKGHIVLVLGRGRTATSKWEQVFLENRVRPGHERRNLGKKCG